MLLYNRWRRRAAGYATWCFRYSYTGAASGGQRRGGNGEVVVSVRYGQGRTAWTVRVRTNGQAGQDEG
jgi:hypothetical protein